MEKSLWILVESPEKGETLGAGVEAPILKQLVGKRMGREEAPVARRAGAREEEALGAQAMATPILASKPGEREIRCPGYGDLNWVSKLGKRGRHASVWLVSGAVSVQAGRVGVGCLGSLVKWEFMEGPRARAGC
ncbi:unnamed protein product [Ilex paraguariensis]|uniref:Uncharacterized protein n=1 Tax=Ilex paraguariensis TaxID=185542 RepID=A0ABC8QT17_9AQUA